MNPKISSPSRFRRTLSASMLSAALLGTTACGNAFVPLGDTSSSAPTTSSSAIPAPTRSSTPATPVQSSASQQSTPSAASTSESATSPAPPAPTSTGAGTMSDGELAVGETAHLANWDVTVQRAEYGEDEVSYGWKVNVCYTAESSQGRDGRIQVSDAVWSAIVQDLEGGDNPVQSIPISKFERDHTYTPDYLNTTLAVGECNLGWIGIVHGNPDLGWLGITYAPSTGETITWTN